MEPHSFLNFSEISNSYARKEGVNFLGFAESFLGQKSSLQRQINIACPFLKRTVQLKSAQHKHNTNASKGGSFIDNDNDTNI